MKFKIYIEYCGANYSGWQKQPKETSVKTVQGTLVNAIISVFKKNKGVNKFIDLQGSGRTDAGVHAIEQAAHLECETMLAPEILKMKMNDELPGDINILEIEKANINFHARHSAKARQYLYVISKRRTAFEKRFVWWIKDRLDVKKMKEAAKVFIGMHDFKAFSEKSPEDKSTKCLVESLEISEDEMKIYIRIRASHFLWKMVRRIVGSLVEVGRGNMTNEEISKLLTPLSLRRGARPVTVGGEELNPAEFTAPPSGLFLEKVSY
jgi:tRNA pseudouridine38-40 synthase